jgi:hypothetical protein
MTRQSLPLQKTFYVERWMPGSSLGMTNVFALRITLKFFADTTSRSRLAFRASFARNVPPSSIRGRGECRAPDAPAASCAHIGSEYAHEYSQRATGITRHSRTQWFTAYIVLSPVIGFLATVACGVASVDLTPAPRRQDHTSLPSALATPVKRAAAFTASRPASVTSRAAPLSGTGRREI